MDINRDIFGRGYKLVTNKLMRQIQLEYITQLEIARILFSQVTPVSWESTSSLTTLPPFEKNDLLVAVAKLKNGKAVGSDNTSSEIAKAEALEGKENLCIANDSIAQC